MTPLRIPLRCLLYAVLAAAFCGVPANGQPAGAMLFDPVASSDPYAIQPYGYSVPAQASGLIDRPIFDGRLLGGGRGLFANPVPYRERMFLRGEYLGWWMDAMDTPPLITTNPPGTIQSQAGFIGGMDTQTLFGGELNDSFRSGFRVQGGWYVDPSRFWAIGGDYYQLFGNGDSFARSSGQTPILGVPFFDIDRGLETAVLVAYPGLTTGNVNVESDTRLRSFGAHVRADAVNAPNSLSQIAGDCGRMPRTDWLVGYRFMSLDDDLRFAYNSFPQNPPPGQINIRETFETENRFHGLELGFIREIPFGRWWFETVTKVAVGNNNQRVNIAGNTRLVESGVPETFPGGIFAQESNIGRYERDRLAVVPELGATLGFHVTPRLSLTGGYTFVYFSNVVRAGDQIDRDINPGQFAVAVDPLTGPLRPGFAFRQTDFYAHGFTVGGDFRF